MAFGADLPELDRTGLEHEERGRGLSLAKEHGTGIDGSRPRRRSDVVQDLALEAGKQRHRRQDVRLVRPDARHVTPHGRRPVPL